MVGAGDGDGGDRGDQRGEDALKWKDQRTREAQEQGSASGGVGKGEREDEHDGAEKTSPLKNPVVRIILLVVLILIVVVFIVWLVGYWTHGRFLQGTDDAYIEADQQTVTNRIAGFVDAIYVDNNQIVRKGQELVHIDDGQPKANVEQAQGQIKQGEASVAQAQAQIREQQATIAQDQAQVANARVQEAFYSRETQRYGPLSASGSETVEKYDQMRENRDADRATVKQNQAGVVAAKRQIAVLQAQVLAGQAQIIQGKGQRDAYNVNLDATAIRANMDGRVGNKSVTLGQYLQAGASLMDVVPVENLYVTANFKETQLGLMRVGEPVTIKVDALKENRLHGKVESFSPGTGAQFAVMPPNNATGNFTKIVQRVPVRIRLEAGPEVRKVLIPGMSVNVSVDTLSARDDVQRFKEEEKRDKDQAKREAKNDNAAVQRATQPNQTGQGQ